ncbi:MAG: DUF370 domain-containing protein [Bacillota bacterium]|jgi:hypothetical protein|nr:DUF370 domain-containing protein [Bacillota bacterium]
MYLHLGGDIVVPLDELIAIIDLESTEHREVTREFLSFAAEEQLAVQIGKETRNKSAILTTRRLYFSPISSVTLLKRAQSSV